MPKCPARVKIFPPSCHSSLPAESVFLDLSDRAKLRLTGADRLRFLNGQVSNDVRRATADASVLHGRDDRQGQAVRRRFRPRRGRLSCCSTPKANCAKRSPRGWSVTSSPTTCRSRMSPKAFGLFHVLDFAGVMDAAASPALPAELADLAPGVRAVHSERYGRRGLDLFFESSRRRRSTNGWPAWASRCSTTTRWNPCASCSACRAGARNWTKTPCPPKLAWKNGR